MRRSLRDVPPAASAALPLEQANNYKTKSERLEEGSAVETFVSAFEFVSLGFDLKISGKQVAPPVRFADTFHNGRCCRSWLV